jgi:N-acetylglutamate synthase-like GNAT family acetyltransferase
LVRHGSVYSLRPALEEDQEGILALIREAGINPFGLRWSRFILAVDENDHLIACGQVKPHRDGSQELASVAVRKGWRKRGIARAIIRELQSKHGRPLWLTCMDRLIPFYETLAFKEITDAAQMPLYFRNARRLFNLYLRIRRTKAYLAVMLWQ